MRIAAIVQARMSSRRLPGKILQQLLGKPMVQFLLERLQLCRAIDSWVLATSTDSSDDPVEEFARTAGIPWFRGPLDDVPRRLLMAAESVGADVILRLSGDSPFLDQAVIDRGAELFRTGQWDIVTNVRPRTFPPGCSVEVIGAETLRAVVETMPDEEREHVIRPLYDDPALTVHNYEHSRDLSDLRLTVDDRDEFEAAERILGAMTRSHLQYSIDEIYQLARSTAQLQTAA